MLFLHSWNVPFPSMAISKRLCLFRQGPSGVCLGTVLGQSVCSVFMVWRCPSQHRHCFSPPAVMKYRHTSQAAHSHGRGAPQLLERSEQEEKEEEEEEAAKCIYTSLPQMSHWTQTQPLVPRLLSLSLDTSWHLGENGSQEWEDNYRNQYSRLEEVESISPKAFAAILFYHPLYK